MQLTAFQDGFSAALIGRAAQAPWLSALESQPGFAVYRNTVLKGCIDALQASYPTVCQLVGTDWFRAAAAVYARAQPPRDGLLMDYGDGFAHFLDQFAPAADLPYLSAVARLDRCWTECHLAADATASALRAQQAPRFVERRRGSHRASAPLSCATPQRSRRCRRGTNHQRGPASAWPALPDLPIGHNALTPLH